MEIKTVGLNDVKLQRERVEQRIDHYAKVFSEKSGEFDELNISFKLVHKASEKAHPIYEVNANLVKGSNVVHGHSEDYDVVDAVNMAFDTISQSVRKSD